MPNCDFPRTLYKRDKNGTQDFTNKFVQHIMYNSLVVNNKEERDVAEGMGYIDNYHDAIFGIPDPEPKPRSKKKINEEF